MTLSVCMNSISLRCCLFASVFDGVYQFFCVLAAASSSNIYAATAPIQIGMKTCLMRRMLGRKCPLGLRDLKEVMHYNSLIIIKIINSKGCVKWHKKN